MKKSFIIGMLAAALVAGGGAGVFVTSAKAKGNTESNIQHNMNSEKMSQMMQSGNSAQMNEMMQSKDHMNSEQMNKMMEGHNMTFEQMLPHAKQMHPELSEDEIEEMHNNMHK